MPLVAHNELPTFSRLRESGQIVLTPERARQQDIRKLHIGLLNMMPDAALSATELQFIRLVGSSRQNVQFCVYPFSIPQLNRGAQAEAHIGRYYANFDDLKRQGLDALIITGANVANPSLDLEPFWDPLIEIVRWAEDQVASIMCSCLATHALLKHRHGIDRRRLPRKQWGVYVHTICEQDHPLMHRISARFDAPHSRYNEITTEQVRREGLMVLAESREAGLHLAVSPDRFRIVYFQGHPEYQANSLLKEYKREVFRYFDGDRDSLPRYPEHYFSEEAIDIASRYIDEAQRAVSDGDDLPLFPEDELTAFVENTWVDTGKAIFDNWLGLVCRVTAHDRSSRFAHGVDPDNPLDIKP